MFTKIFIIYSDEIKSTTILRIYSNEIKGYRVIPVIGYRETPHKHRAYKIIGKYNKNISWMLLSKPIWEPFTLTARYAFVTEKSSTMGIQMFDHLDDDEKIQALRYNWWNNSTAQYIKQYFKDHEDLRERAKKSLKIKDMYYDYKNLFR